jgi:ribosomal protein S13
MMVMNSVYVKKVSSKHCKSDLDSETEKDMEKRVKNRCRRAGRHKAWNFGPEK